MKSSASGLTTAAVAIAAALSLNVTGPHRANAAPVPSVGQTDGSLAVTVLSPTPRTSFTGNKPVEVSAFYQGTSGNEIVALELYVDGIKAAVKTLEAPESRGVISFLVDASQLKAGTHRVVIRAVGADAEIVSAKSSFVYVPAVAQQEDVPAQAPIASGPPQLSFVTPSADDKVTGTLKIKMRATDASGAAPYVSVFIDKNFKTLRNYPPYEYEWDTTAYTNGYHTIEVYAYNDAQNVGPAQVMRVYVNNPGGQTALRTDLKDAAPVLTHKKVSLAPASKPIKRMPRKPLTARNLSAPYIAPSIQPKHAVHQPVATKPVDSIIPKPLLAPRKDVHPTLMASGIHTEQTAILNLSGLQSPFIPDTATATKPHIKAVGPARRPSPLMSRGNAAMRTAKPVLMAKRTDEFDDTSSLNLNSQLSDPYIPETTTPRPAQKHNIATPTAHFKPLPQPGASVAAPAIASETVSLKSAPISAGKLLHMSAGTVAALKKPAPFLIAPAIKASAPAKIASPAKPAVTTPKPAIVSTPAAPIHKDIAAVHTQPITFAKPVVIHTESTPAAKPVAVHTPAAPVAKSIEIHTTITPIAKHVEMHTATVPAVKPIAVHTPSAPVVKPVAIHTPATPIAAKPAAIHTPAIPAAQHAAIHTTAAPAAKPLAIHTPAAPVAKPVVVHTPSKPLAKPFVIRTSPRPVFNFAAPQMPAIKKHVVAVHTMGTTATSNLIRGKGQTSVLFNSTVIRLDRPIMPKGNIMFSPIRQIFEFEGGSLTWQHVGGKVLVKTENQDILLTVGKRSAMVNNKLVTLDSAPYISRGRTMVPMSFLSKAMDVDIKYDAQSGHVLITNKS